MNLLSSLNISAGALSVNEKAISVVSHNVSNMNTEGYHKQRVNLEARNIAGQIGDNPNNQVRANGGVKIANVMRYNDDYLNNYYRQQLSEKNKLEQQLGNLDDLAKIFDDLEGQGIDGALGDFYEALNNLQQYPASATARTNFIERAKTLTSTLNAKSVQLSKMTGEALGDGKTEESLKNSRIYTQYRDFNSTLEELAAVNKALQTTQTGTLTANNLLDKRDLILHDMSQYVDLNVEEHANGTVDVSVGDTPLVKSTKIVGQLDIETAAAYKQRTGLDSKEAAVINIVQIEEDGSKSYIKNNANDDIQGGSIGGLLHFGTDNQDGQVTAGSVQTSLDKLAQTVAKIFNELNTAYDSTNGYAYKINASKTDELEATTPDNDMFSAKIVNADGSVTESHNVDDITAGNIRVSSNLLKTDGIWNIACAHFDTPDVDVHAVGNAQNVIKMLGTRTEKQADLQNMSIEDFYSSMVGGIAAAGDSTRTLYETQVDVVDSLENQLDSAYGVDLNEELVDLVKYQTAYAAAAQVFNVVNSCLDTLMSLGR